MELLILLLLSPAILAQRYGKSNDPNDEPFLPIYPVYPYSPKLIKRGTERDTITQLTPELYAPKVDAKDSYSASFSTNYPREPYYPNYNPYPRVASASTYSPYYNSMPYSYSTAPYNSYNSYSTPYTMTPPSYANMPYSSSYPNYYYQPPYHYPNYYNQPLFPPPPPVPAADYLGSDDSYSDSETGNKNKEKKSSGNQKSKDNDLSQDTGNQFVDGANYISGNSKDLDGQPSTYKVSSPQNQLEQVNEIPLKHLPIPLPKTTYRVISVAGQPVGPDYPLPAPYVKAQQLEELMSQTWAKLLTQNSQQQAAQYPAYEANKNAARPNDGLFVNQNDFNKDAQRFISVPNVLAKTGLTYVINPNILGKVNIAQPNGQILQAPTTLSKSTKYAPVTRLALEQSPGVFMASGKPEKDQTSDPNDYDSYENPSPQSDSKQPQNYENDQGQPVSYQNPNFVTVQTPQGYSYQYTNYNPPQTSTQQQSQQYKTNLEDVNFGAKQTNKG